MRSAAPTSSSLTPLLVSRPVCKDSPTQLSFSPKGFSPTAQPPQPTKPHLLLQRIQPVHQEVTSCCEVLEPSWAETVPAPGLSAGVNSQHPEPHPHHRPCSRNSSSSGSQRLKNKTKNLWNPTYGSWVLESFRPKKTLAHTQSMPLSSSTSNLQSCNSSADTNKAVCDGTSSTYLSPACQVQAAPTASSHKAPTGGTAKAAMDLAKLQSFPCGNVNYAYDERSYEAESLPLVKPKVSESITSTMGSPSVLPGTGLGLALGFSTASACMPKLLLKRHASYGHEDIRRHVKTEKLSRDRDSGFSLSEDLSVAHI